MNFRGKLNAIVPILTFEKYKINQEHLVYQQLASPISRRNQLVHPQPSSEEVEVEKWIDSPVPPFVPFPVTPDLWERSADVTMGAARAFGPLEYHDAIRRLHPALRTLDAKQMMRPGATAPLHKGAEKYYREKGMM